MINIIVGVLLAFLVAAFWLIVVITRRSETLRYRIYELEVDLRFETIANRSWVDIAHESNEAYVAIREKLLATERMLDLALQAKPGNFNHVVTELGLNGVVYQFNRIEENV